MNRVKFELDRIRGEMYKMKQEYFELREASQREVLNQRNFVEEVGGMGGMNQKDKGIMDMGISTVKK